MVFICNSAVIRCNWRVVHRVDRHRHRGRICSPVAVAHRVGKGVCAGKITRRCVSEAAIVIDQDTAVGHVVHTLNAQRISIRIRIIGEHVNYNRGIFICNGNVINSHGDIIDRVHR